MHTDSLYCGFSKLVHHQRTDLKITLYRIPTPYHMGVEDLPPLFKKNYEGQKFCDKIAATPFFFCEGRREWLGLWIGYGDYFYCGFSSYQHGRERWKGLNKNN
ncbi:unnamed protein product [Cylicocyclus nassatus]|uniref:Uncharacterized protein n=1 Tax=Cylicocyclus nassatus TaxID=53992 RepID=A0AA36DRM1_CYLNA|nr:unnamed protein product [Cylicocyclus nassatus]